MIQLDRVTRSVSSGAWTLTILDDISLAIPAGQFVAVIGPSGSGKSTLLGLMAGLDRPTRGTVIVDGHDLGSLGEDEVARIRGRTIGVVFQSFHLIPTLTAQETVQVPLELAGRTDAARRAAQLLDRVGLAQRGHHHPVQLSGGEQQRVAIARAFASEGSVLLADEPTGSLDSRSGDMVLELLVGMNTELHTTLVMVTHNPDIARRADRVITLADGRVGSDSLSS
ncbi:MAG: ABC transporter ATP-binding protein [Candidatus Riflebacteria bacterium]|nr:ABC transporter ATP-binding protein [Candidatus Riflebacteria bacterium]